MKLINKIKPEILIELHNEVKVQYSSSYKFIITSLEEVEYYNDLTVDAIKTITAFLPSQYQPKNELDYFYGDNILSKEYQL